MTPNAGGRNRTASDVSQQSAVDIRTVVAFLGLTVAVSWGGVATLSVAGVDVGTGAGLGVATLVFMGAPALAAVAISILYRDSIRNACGLYLGRKRWIVLAWIAPLGLTAVMILVGVTVLGQSFTTEYSAFLLELDFTEEEAADTIADVEETGIPVAVFLIGLALVLGGTLFALAGFGEELGWRGLLLTELAPLGFWKLSLLTGLVWGIWHVPLILLGLQFPDDTILGIVSFTAATLALSPIYTYLTVRARSVLAATFFHGSFVLGVFTWVFMADGSELVISPVGLVGIVAALVGVAACVGHDRLRADERIITGDPLSPWSHTR